MTIKAAHIPSQTNVDFFCRNVSGQWWNTSGTPAFENYNGANLTSYRIAATETPADSGIYVATEPTGTVEFELRVRDSTLAASYIVAGPALTDAGEALATRSAVGLESANLASLVNAVVGKQNVTDNGNGTYDIAIRNAADSATLVTIRYNPTTGVKTVV